MASSRQTACWIPGALVVVVGLMALSALSQESVTHVRDTFFVQPTRPPVVFHHDEHNENAQIEECHRCHHVYTDGRLSKEDSSEDQECSECHLSDGRLGVIRAYHQNCRGCHLERQAGPVTCAGCHPKEPV